VTGVSGTTLSWSTKWTWAGGSSSVKSFANAVVVQSSIKKVSAISTIPTVWQWTYSGSSVVADVAYDMFTSSTSGGSAQYEIMIWLDAIGGAGPISSTGSSIATVTLASVTFKLYKGVNGAMTVFSFVASPSGSTAKNFSGDLKTFFTYLINNQGFPSSQYLNSIGAGTEPFTGKIELSF
jgi:xyloglucan-specific endo-beta-1,4-glucanase